MRIAAAFAVAIALFLFATCADAHGVYSEGGFNPFNLPGGSAIVPTASVGILAPNPWASSRGTQAAVRPEMQAALWAGVAFHPQAGVISPWTAVGSEFNTRSTPDGKSTWEYVPEMRFGVSGVADDVRHNHAWVMLPLLETYGIAGYRLPDTRAGFERNGAPRVGLGISSPALAVLILGVTAKGGKPVPVPSMFETTVDFEREGTRQVNLRVGWQF